MSCSPFRTALFAGAAFFLCAVVVSAAPRRLPTDVAPTFQLIRLKLDPDKRSYSGTVKIELAVKQATDSVVFHAEGQRLVRVALVQNGDSIGTTRTSGDRGRVTLRAARPLATGRASLEIDFTHLFGTRAVGLYRTVKQGRGYLFTQFEAVDAREAFPCWDEPSYKIPYQFVIEAPDSQVVLANTPEERVDRREGWRTTTFKRSPPMPSYLLALAAGPFELYPVPGTSVPARIVTVRGQGEFTRFAIETTPKLLAALERWFGTKCPYEKLDFIAVPEYAYGAMENPGLITYREDILLVDAAHASLAQKRNHARVHAHEMAHLWFGDLVTMAWWDDLWLNESFADWMGDKMTEEVYPEFRLLVSERADLGRILAGDAKPSTQPIRSDDGGDEDGLGNVGLVYNKGKTVLGMFEQWLGPEAFQKGVRAYLKEHAWGNATASDLWSALDRTSGRPVSKAMTTFIDQPGVPSVRVTVLPDGRVQLRQQRYSTMGTTLDAMRWSIPVGLRWSDGKTVRTDRVLLADETMTVKLPGKPAWVMPNTDGAGYYVWSIPQDMLVALSSRAATELSPGERVTFLNNLGMLMDAGEVRGDAYLRAIAAFGNDTEPQVVSSVTNGLAKVQGAFVPDSLESLFAPYVRRTLQPAVKRFGLEKRAGEDEIVSTLRPELITWLGRRGHDEEVVRWAEQLAKRYLSDPNAVDPGSAGAVLNLAAMHGDRAMFETYEQRFENAKSPADRRIFLSALGSFNDPELERAALAVGMGEKTAANEAFMPMMSFGAKGRASGDRLFQWVMDNWDAIAKKLPPPALAFMPMMGSGCDEERLAATQAFFAKPEHQVPGTERALERVRDQVRDCVGLRAREGAVVAAYLRSMVTN